MATRVTVTSPWAKAPPERGAGHVFVIVGRGSFMREVIVDVCMRKHLLNEWIIPYRRPRTFNSHSWLYYQHYWALTSVAVWSNPHYPPLMVSASLTPPLQTSFIFRLKMNMSRIPFKFLFYSLIETLWRNKEQRKQFFRELLQPSVLQRL